jgi:hypothetical protein
VDRRAVAGEPELERDGQEARRTERRCLALDRERPPELELHLRHRADLVVAPPHRRDAGGPRGLEVHVGELRRVAEQALGELDGAEIDREALDPERAALVGRGDELAAVDGQLDGALDPAARGTPQRSDRSGALIARDDELDLGGLEPIPDAVRRLRDVVGTGRGEG